jgi:hypothetical protein
VLVEHNVQPDDSITTFTVAPENGGRAASVTIETQMPLRPGLAGQIERLVTMWVMRSMYVAELKKLAEVAAR